MTEPDAFERLTTEQLREQAFAKARQAHDVAFFWDLMKHQPSAADLGSDDGSAGGLGETITGLVELATGHLGQATPAQHDLYRAHYLSYLRA